MPPQVKITFIASVFRGRHLPRDAEYDAHFRQLAQQCRAAIAEEGQGNAGSRHQARDHGDVQEGLEPGEGHEAHHQQGTEPVPGVEGNPEAPEDQQGKHQHDNAGPHQPQLLADHGEDAVVVLLGQVEEFLPPLAQAHAQQAAGADGDLTLSALPADASIIIRIKGIQTGNNAACAVFDLPIQHQVHIQRTGGCHTADAHGDQPALDAAHDHQHETRADDEDGAGQMRLQHHKTGNDQQDRHIGPDAMLPGLHFLAFFGDGGREEDHHGDFGNLGGLAPQNGALDAQPAGGAVFRDGNGVAGDDDQHQ